MVRSIRRGRSTTQRLVRSGSGDIKSLHNYFRPLKVKPEERAFAFSRYGGYMTGTEHLYSKNRSATARTRTRHSTRKR